MHAHASTITRFYQAFAARDAAAMQRCYHPEVHFRDEVFDLHGQEAGAMWEMLVTRGKDLTLSFGGIAADDASGRASWEARYTFRTGRKVVNRISATFTFRDGLILTHTDAFDFRAWAKQALGPIGYVLGGSAWLRRKVRGSAMASLRAYMAEPRARIRRARSAKIHAHQHG